MTVHDVRLTRRETVAEGTMAFYFSRPPAFPHQAGQSLLMTLVDPPETDGEGDARTFTIASAPHDPELMIATRMRDTAFKRALKAAPIGTTVRIDGPNGEMVLHDDASRPAVFLAGGIGITPFLSMARHAAHKRLPHPLYLFYSNRRPEDAAFLAELQDLEQRNPKYRLIATMAEPEKASEHWSGETGFIRREMLERHVPDIASPMYYFAGPPPMTMAMQKMLEDIGISEGAMRYEEFYGY
ncbi:MAG TPA: FAD-dependent oxidoreductase [Burkholderiales bacterium]|jgi:ferredoxin-NADP reductase|nr:FAD-dependent oxidoreductase [Burkholderiales bacterium]